MSDHRFGQRHFSTRDRLRLLMRDIDRLARETATSPRPALPLASDDPQQDHPLCFAVFGEINTGKSSLLNALIGHPLCPVSELPRPVQPYRHYRYGTQGESDDNGIEICHRPLEILRSVEVIDSPGLHADALRPSQALRSRLERCELIFCLLPITNPWSALSWDFLAALPSDLLAKTVLLIQQSDRVKAIDLEVMKGHILDLAGKKLDRVPAVLPFSAKLVIERGASDRDSGMPQLRALIEQHIEALPARHAMLESWQADCAKALDAIEKHIDVQARLVRDQHLFMEGIEQEIVELREASIRQLPHHLVEITETFEKEAAGISKLLHRRLGALFSIVRVFIGDRTTSLMESLFIERIQASVEAVADKDSRQAVACCADHWHQLEQRLESAMGVRPNPAHSPEEHLAASRGRFVEGLRDAAQTGINNLKVRNQIDLDIRRRHTALKSFTASALILLGAAGCCGALGLHLAPWILLGLAVLFLCGGLVTAWLTRATIVRNFREQLLRTCSYFAAGLGEQYEEALRTVYRDYTEMLGEVRDHLARQKLAVEPHQRAWQQCFLTMKEIEQERRS